MILSRKISPQKSIQMITSSESMTVTLWMSHVSSQAALLQWSKWDESESHSFESDSLHYDGLLSPWISLGQNTGVESLSLHQGNLPNPGIKPRSLAL